MDIVLVQSLPIGELETKWVGATVLSRGLFMPVIGGGVVLLADRFGFLPDDPVYKLILYSEQVMPTAQVLVLLAQLARENNDDGGQQAQQIARLLFVQYVAMTLPLTLWMSLFLSVTLGS